jgi:hypothetical protein
MRSLALALAAFLVLLSAPVSADFGSDPGANVEGRIVSISLSRNGSPGRTRAGSSRWVGCSFYGPLSEEGAEQVIHPWLPPVNDKPNYFDSTDPEAEFTVWRCPAAVGFEFGGWEINETPPIEIAERLADYAFEEIWIPELIPVTSPFGTEETPLILNLETWLWVEEWTDQSATAWMTEFPADWVQVTLIPERIRYESEGLSSGDCAPGTPWSPGAEPDCSIVYEILPEPGFYTVDAFAYYTADVECPGNWCGEAALETRYNALLAVPFESTRDVFVDQVRGLVTQ